MLYSYRSQLIMRNLYILILLVCLAGNNFVQAQQNSDNLEPEATRNTRNINILNSQRLQEQRTPSNVVTQLYNNGFNDGLRQKQYIHQGQGQPTNQHRPIKTSVSQNSQFISAPGFGSGLNSVGTATRFQDNRGTPNQFGSSLAQGIGQYGSSQGLNPRQQGSSQWAGTGQHISNQVTPLRASANRFRPVRVPAPQNQYLNQVVGSEQRLAPVTAPLLQGVGQVGGGQLGINTNLVATGTTGGLQTGNFGTAGQVGISGGGQQFASSQGLSAGHGGVGGIGLGSAIYTIENIMDGPYWDGSYYYRYETSDGAYREEGGVPNGQCRGAMLSIRGSFSHVTPRGVVVHHEYMSDKNGYSAFPAGSRPDVFTPPERQPIPPQLPPGGIQPCTPEDLGFN